MIFLLTGCPDPEPDNNDQQKTITITGVAGKTDYLSIGVYDEDGNLIAIGWSIQIRNNSASVPLTTINVPPSPWTGSGSYCITLGIGESTTITTNDESYVYTDGNPLPDPETYVGLFNALPKYNITQPESRIPFNKFVEQE